MKSIITAIFISLIVSGCGTSPIKQPDYQTKLNSDVEYLNNFIELLISLTLSEFVSLKNYLVAKIEFEEYSRKNENDGFVKIIRHNS